MGLKKKLTLYLILTSSVFLGFLLEENSSGGSKIDYNYLLPYIIEFQNNLKLGFELFINNPSTLIHSPVFYIIIGLINRFLDNILLIKIFYIGLSCSLPFVFYLILKSKYKIETDFFFYLSLLIFFSPFFRSSAIWLTGDNLSLIFFSLSILFFLKTNSEKKVSNYYLCLVFLILCCYIRYYFCLFALYFLYDFYNKVNKKIFLNVVLLSFLLSLPALFYLYQLIYNYKFLNYISDRVYINYLSNLIVILSIFLFYTFPFILFEIPKIFKYHKSNIYRPLFIFVIIILIIIIDKFINNNLISYLSYGGGVFVKISQILEIDVDLFLPFVAFFSLLIIDYLFEDQKFKNYLIFLILILSFPLPIIYQKYMDPLFYIFLFGLINSTYIKNLIFDKSVRPAFLFMYFGSFFLFSYYFYL